MKINHQNGSNAAEFVSVSGRGRRPLRVLPLAVGAAALVCGSMAAAREVLHTVTGDRYVIDIIKEKLKQVA